MFLLYCCKLFYSNNKLFKSTPKTVTKLPLNHVQYQIKLWLKSNEGFSLFSHSYQKLDNSYTINIYTTLINSFFCSSLFAVPHPSVKKYVIWCLICGGLSCLLGVMFLGVYFLLRSYTSTVGYFETVPTFVPATLVSLI